MKNSGHHTLRVAGAVALALAVVLVVIIIVLSYLGAASRGQSLSQEQKMHILAGLSSSSGVSVVQKKKILQQLTSKSSGSSGLSETAKANVLHGLH